MYSLKSLAMELYLISSRSTRAVLTIETRRTLSLEAILVSERFGRHAYWDSVLMGQMVQMESKTELGSEPTRGRGR